MLKKDRNDRFDSSMLFNELMVISYLQWFDKFKILFTF